MDKTEILKLLYEAERLSTCKKRKVGAVIIANNGEKYFGANQSMLSSKGVCYACNIKSSNVKELCPAIHAEIACLLKAGEKAAGSTLIISYSPCPECCKAIIAAGIKQVIVLSRRLKPVIEQFWYLYETTNYDELAEAMLKAAKIKYIRLNFQSKISMEAV